MPFPLALDRLLQARLGGVAVVAHRGDAVRFPENTIPAFESAAALGVAAIEFDVRATRDLVPVCIHDETVERTTDGGSRGAVADASVGAMDYALLASMDAGSWKGSQFVDTRVPSLAAALKTIHPRVVPMIECKDGAPELYVESLSRNGMVDDVLLHSFDWDWLHRVRALEPRIALGALGGRDDRPSMRAGDFATLRALGACFVHWRVDRVDAELVRSFHEVDLPIGVFAPDDEREFARLVDIGVDMITTGEPERLQRFLSR